MNKRDAGALQSYFIEISRIPLLTQDDEIALAKRLDGGARGFTKKSSLQGTGCRQSRP